MSPGTHMGIAVFDIDGTLTDTTEVDAECYEAAVHEVTGIRIPSDWASFPDVTDAAILTTTCARLGRPAPPPEVERRIAERVGALLRAARSEHPDRFRAIPGARAVFEDARRAGWRVAMATGAWRPSALVKLEAARIPTAGVPLATSSDRPARADIIRHAVDAVLASSPDTSGPEAPRRIVYVGDGVWDGRAAISLGCTFVGVAGENRSAALKRAGATRVVSDLTGVGRLLAELAV